MSMRTFVPAWLVALRDRPNCVRPHRPRRRFRPCLELLEDRLVPAPILVTNANDSGPGSLRLAIVVAETLGGRETIDFNIQSPGGPGPASIALVSPLPALTGPVTIAGDTQPGFQPGLPLIELNGAAAGPGANGLVFRASGCVVRGLIIDRFGGNGILAMGATGDIEGCFIGTNAAGTAAAGNGAYGILIAGPASSVHVGGTTPASRNVISGNGAAGVGILGGATTSNSVVGNFIGTDVTGAVPLGNALGGVRIGGGASRNIIGGSVDGAGNVISDNGSDGVALFDFLTQLNTVQGNTIVGNKGDGVSIFGGAFHNSVGGASAVVRNVISGNTLDGVVIRDRGTTQNIVQGNFIGTNKDGTAALGNGGNGVSISNATFNAVGVPAPGAGNVISGNRGTGVSIVGSGRIQVDGNFIGTSADGSAALRNGGEGVVLDSSTRNTVGGALAGARNIISGQDINLDINAASANLVQGNLIGTDAAGRTALGNPNSQSQAVGLRIHGGAAQNTVGGASVASAVVPAGTLAPVGNLISGNGNGDGILIEDAGSTGNLVQGNFIGTNLAGTAALANGSAGVDITSSANTVGGTAAGAGNVISGNGGSGVVFAVAGTTGNLVAGNLIGTNSTGTAALANSNDGVDIINSSANTVGGTAAGAGNVISGNGGDGIDITSLLPGARNLVAGNFIGTNKAGSAALPNHFIGVNIFEGGSNNTVGGTAAGARNVISGNGGDGVDLSNGSGNLVLGNLIGTNAAGTAALANGFAGVEILSSANTLGGAAAGAANIISGNGTDGVQIHNGATGNLVQGNLIGLDVLAKALGNTSHGVFITGGAANNTIGGTTAGAGNRIAYNRGDGVLIGSDPQAGFTTPAGSGNSVEGNSIFANAGLGIELGPPDPNNPGGPVPNDAINPPVLTSVFLSGTSLYLTGFLDTGATGPFRIEIFTNPSGGQGQTFLTALSVVTNNGVAVFAPTLVIPATVVAGQTVTATVTDGLGNTSEFSLPLTIE
jgi:titin